MSTTKKSLIRSTKMNGRNCVDVLTPFVQGLRRGGPARRVARQHRRAAAETPLMSTTKMID